MIKGKKYYATTRSSNIDLKQAVVELSPLAFKMLFMIYKRVVKNRDLKDSTFRTKLGVSDKTFANAKYELKDKGYLQITYAGTNRYIFILGSKAIESYNKQWRIKADKEYEDMAREYFESNFKTKYDIDDDDFNPFT